MSGGGTSDKLGNEYESLWAAQALLKVLEHETASIFIEPPGVRGIEFKLTLPRGVEYWQCKYHVTSKGSLSLRDLKTAGVLSAIRNRLSKESDTTFHFASNLSVPGLFRIVSDIDKCEDYPAYQDRYLSKTPASSNPFFEFCRLLAPLSEKEAFDILRRVHVPLANIEGLEPQLEMLLRHMFDAPARILLRNLQMFYIQSAERQIDARIIRSEALEGVAIRPVHLRPAHPDKKPISRQTIAFIQSEQRQRVLPDRLPRPELTDLIRRIEGATGPFDILLTGAPGGGKSTAGAMLAEWFRERGATVFAFRLDGIDQPRSTDHLGELLGLSASPVRALVATAKSAPSVLFVDQLDAISGVSGRMQRSAEVVKDLLEEVKRARADGHCLHLILACRQMDLDYDHRLAALLGKQTLRASFNEFSGAQVQQFLASQNSGQSDVSHKQLELLKRPLHLALYAAVSSVKKASLAIADSGRLFAEYWNTVRELTEEQAQGDYWLQALELMTAAMERHQGLSIPRADLDRLPNRYVKALAGSGVIVVENERIRFRHEAFYDYCYARLAIASGRDLFDEIVASKQHLHKRSQVRQILNYLRDTDRSGFRNLASKLLLDERVLFHLKQLTAVVLCNTSSPSSEEIALLVPYLDRHLEERARGVEAEKLEPFCARMFEAFHRSRAWFPAIVAHGHLERWRKAWRRGALGAICHYIGWQARVHPDDVAKVLSNWTSAGILNNEQIRTCFFLADLHSSRRLFDLFVRLVSKGKLDELREHGVDSELSKRQPGWYAELVGGVLGRWIALSKLRTEPAWQVKLQLVNALEGSDVLECAKAAPLDYLHHVLPRILGLIELNSYQVNSRLQYDHLWNHRWRDDHPSTLWSLVIGCETAFESTQVFELLDPWLSRLVALPYSTANSLLIHLCIAHPARYAEQILELVIAEPDRLDCGLADSDVWFGQELLRRCSPHCSARVFAGLEKVIVGYNRVGRGFVAQDAYKLCSAMAQERLSKAVRIQLSKWKERFPKMRMVPRKSVIHGVHSPVPKAAAAKMSDRQWIGAMRKHHDPRFNDWDNPSKGGANELAQVLEEETKKDPNRFAKLWFDLPPDLHATYPWHLLRGLKENRPGHGVTMRVVASALGHADKDCRQVALEIIQIVAVKRRLPAAVIKTVATLATDSSGDHEPRPIAGEHIGTDLYFLGLQCTRGAAVIALANALNKDRRLVKVANSVVTCAIENGPLGVKATAIRLACNLTPVNPRRAVDQFLRITALDDRLLATQLAQRFLSWATRRHLHRVLPRLRRLLGNDHSELQEIGGRMLAIANLHHPKRVTLVRNVLRGPVDARLGLVAVANANLNEKKNRKLAEKWLPVLFRDKATPVQLKAAECFQKLWHKDRAVLHKYDQLIRNFLDSPAFASDPTHLLYALEHSPDRLTDVAIEVCEGYERLRTGTPSSSVQRDDHIAFDLALRCYVQLKEGPAREHALRLIDRLCLQGVDTFSSGLKDLD